MKNKKATTLLTITVTLIITITLLQPANQIQAQPEPHWVAHPMYISPYADSSAPIGYIPEQIKKAYNLNQTSNGGSGTTIAIIDAYDTPNILDSFNAFSHQFGLPDNSSGNLIVYKMPGTVGTDSGWAMETCLDVEWAHAIAPNATILLVEAADESDSSLLPAISYATSYPGVVAVSMSWGTNEFWGETSYDSYFNVPGISFFASSGDDGKYVSWPAVSAMVIGVGGTTLNLNPDNTTASETAWQNSSGGVSKYVPKPSFQATFGTAYPMRSVPDVSFDANPSTGFAVYNGTWWKVGGTSAGAPQWAAIHALSRSVTNANLYGSAQTAYSYYFRDITTGHNYNNNATLGYDLVTGLGSPLTMHYDTQVSVTPAFGPANGTLALSGMGFAGSSVNVSYVNPFDSSRVSIENNTAVTNGTFSLSVNATDLLQNNPVGDNSPLSDSIVFSAVDNSNGNVYNASYTEYRRGLTQLGNAYATGLFGNNTNLASQVIAQNGDVLAVAGEWFSPGNVTLLWDNQTLANAAVDGTGSFNTSLTVPTTTGGVHTLTVNDGAAYFCVNVSREPYTSSDYTGAWHNADFNITLTPDSQVNETFYRINGGVTCNVTANGEPTITTEGDNNTLEYWNTWNTTETATNETHHVTLSGIKLDKTPPTGTVSTEPTTTSPDITLTLSATDTLSGPAQMRFSNDGTSWSDWTAYAATAPWTLTWGNGDKTVYVEFSDNAGVVSVPYSCTVTLQTPQATTGPQVTASPPPTATPTATPTAKPTATATPSPTPAVPELNVTAILILLAVSTILAVAVFKRRK